MALGAPAISPLFFDVAVLEVYRNDPRYSYVTDDSIGRIEVSAAYAESEKLPAKDRILLPRFGFAYNDDGVRVVAAYPRDLRRLTPEHQSLWVARERSGDFKVHPNLYAITVGSFDLVHTIFEAFREELCHLGKMCQAVGWPEVVRHDFTGERKPANFGFLIRPTAKEMQDFISTLDKMMSDNLNRDFFKHLGLELRYEEKSKNGDVRLRDKGTIQLLADLMAAWNLDGQETVQDMLTAFREVRKARNPQAHNLDDDVFDESLFAQQRELVERAYRAVRYLRIIISQHPDLEDYDDLPTWLRDGRIVVM